MTEKLDLDGLQRLLWSFAQHRTLTVACETGILGRLAEAPASPRKVAHDLGLDADATGKIIRALNAAHYDGPLSVEWEDSGMNREHGAREAVQYCKNVDFEPSGRAFDAAFAE